MVTYNFILSQLQYNVNTVNFNKEQVGGCYANVLEVAIICHNAAGVFCCVLFIFTIRVG